MTKDKMLQDEIEVRNRLESEDSESTNAIMPPSDIVVFNEMRSCADIVRMCEKEILDARPDFQRGIVWSNRDKSLFIDSLIKQLPIPSVCISWDAVTGKRLVIDGLQRISTIVSFLSSQEKDWRLSSTAGADERIAGKLVSEIRRESASLVQKVEDTTLPVNVIRCDCTKKIHMEYLFQIFSRLNSGGKRLMYQEIRNCVYQGSLNSFLKQFVRGKEWLEFVKLNLADLEKYRFGNEERLLRFFAFHDKWDKYSSSLVQFLNSYMAEHRNDSQEKLNSLRELAVKTLNVAVRIRSLKDPRKNWNLVESIIVGMAANIEKVITMPIEEVESRTNGLMQHAAFSDKMKEGVLHAPKLKERIKLSIATYDN